MNKETLNTGQEVGFINLTSKDTEEILAFEHGGINMRLVRTGAFS